ncbi:MAG: hypothetical protein CMP85_08240 [Gammaproteobacteria bacterium]|nr:hypothetical protein [Gammaproteobacteria bacterium]
MCDSLSTLFFQKSIESFMASIFDWNNSTIDGMRFLKSLTPSNILFRKESVVTNILLLLP